MAIEEDITIDAGEFSLPAALALPESGDGPWPGVVVFHEIFGLNADIRRIAARFADSGYVALAPDMYAGPGPKPICVARTLIASVWWSGTPSETVRTAQTWLSERDDVDGARIGAAGFCMGGGFALMLGARADAGAVATYYGSVPKQQEKLEGICPVLSSYGGRDMLYRGRRGKLIEHLRALGVPHDTKVYPNVGHGFMSQRRGVSTAPGLPPFRAGYNEDAAEDSWKRMLAFFAEHLGPA